MCLYVEICMLCAADLACGQKKNQRKQLFCLCFFLKIEERNAVSLVVEVCICIKYRSFLQESPIKETILCKRDL